MCGICGIISSSKSGNRQRVQRMLDRMSHRGPDGQGFWQSKDLRVSLGHVRLAIVDPSPAGTQPMHAAPGLSQVVNGEFYNFTELKRDLKLQSNFVSDCDSEILLHGYSEKGLDFVSSLNGMFAFALHDEKADKVYLARDRMGIKPLYYCFHDGEFIFASEIKALFGAMDVDTWQIDLHGLSEYLTYQTPLGDRTLFENVKQVLPGHILSLDTDTLKVFSQTPYWKPDFGTINKDLIFENAAELFSNTLKKSVSRHLLGDVGLSSYLSAGFDSAAVFSAGSQISVEQTGAPLTAFTGQFEQATEWYRETGPAGRLADSLDAEHRTTSISAIELKENIDDVIDALDEPRMGMGAFSQFMVAKDVAKDFKVVLTGHGGDELFSGYPVFSYVSRGIAGIRNLSELPHFVYFFLSDVKGKLFKEFGRKLPVLWSVKDQANLLGVEADLLKPWSYLELITENANDKYQALYLTYLQAYLPGLLIVEDKISMAHSVESRTPLLDNEMLALSQTIPGQLKLTSNNLKAVIKSHSRNNLPTEYMKQPKRGFPTPLRFWLRNELTQLLDERLLGQGRQSYLTTIFEPQEIKTIIKNYRKSWYRMMRPLDEIQSHKIWQLLSLEAWLRIWSQKYGVTLRLP